MNDSQQVSAWALVAGGVMERGVLLVACDCVMFVSLKKNNNLVGKKKKTLWKFRNLKFNLPEKLKIEEV